MKKLVLKTLLLLGIFGLVKLPFALTYEDELTHRRAAFAGEPFTAVFVGSSRTKYGVIPAYFDRLAGGDVRSYNFGVEAGVPPYTFDWCEELIESHARLKYVFFELSGGREISERYKAPWREFYWREYAAALENLSFEEAQKYHNRLAIDFFKPALAEQYNDFVGYNVPLGEALAEKAVIFPDRKRLQPEGLLAAERRSLAAQAATAEWPLDEEYWSRVARLIDLADARGVRLYFYIPPRLETDGELRAVLPVYLRLDRKYRLDIHRHDASLYRAETSYDEHHLNHAGALRLTGNFAKLFKSAGY